MSTLRNVYTSMQPECCLSFRIQCKGSTETNFFVGNKYIHVFHKKISNATLYLLVKQGKTKANKVKLPYLGKKIGILEDLGTHEVINSNLDAVHAKCLEAQKTGLQLKRKRGGTRQCSPSPTCLPSTQILLANISEIRALFLNNFLKFKDFFCCL